MTSLVSLEPFMFTFDKVSGLLAPKPKEETIIIEEETNEFGNNLLKPKDKDSLFWGFIICKYGIVDYSLFPSRNLLTEKKLKIEYVERIKKEKTLFKPYKFITLTSLEEDLVSKETISLATLFALCILGHINIMYIKKRTFYELQMNDTSTLYLVQQLHTQPLEYGFTVINTGDMKEVREKYYLLDNLAKPLKAISSYKTEEISEIAKKLKLKDDKKETKKDLYDKIRVYLGMDL